MKWQWLGAWLAQDVLERIAPHQRAQHVLQGLLRRGTDDDDRAPDHAHAGEQCQRRPQVRAWRGVLTESIDELTGEKAGNSGSA